MRVLLPYGGDFVPLWQTAYADSLTTIITGVVQSVFISTVDNSGEATPTYG